MSKPAAAHASKPLGGKGGKGKKPPKIIPMELAVVPSEEAKRLQAALANRIPWDIAIKAVVDSLTATKWVAVARGSYKEVPDHAIRLKGFDTLRDTVTGRPGSRAAGDEEEVPVDGAEEAKMDELAANPEYVEAARKHLAWLESRAQKS